MIKYIEKHSEKYLEKVTQIKIPLGIKIAVLAIVQILVLIGVIRHAINESGMSLGFSQEDLIIWDGSAGTVDPNPYLAVSFGNQDAVVVTPRENLDTGIYNISITYELHGSATVYADHSNNEKFRDSLNATMILDERAAFHKFNTMVKENDSPLGIIFRLASRGSDDYLLVRNVTVTKPPPLKYNLLVCIYYLALVNATIFVIANANKIVNGLGSLSSEQRIVSGGLVLTIIMTSLPAFVSYVLPGHDIWFHLMRIEGIKDGFLSGQFPVRIQPGWMNEHGYATSIMYGELLLYLPALLRWFGFPLGLAYNLYVIGVNITTVLVAYYCFKKIAEDSLCGLMMTIFYSANVYRLTNLYTRSAVGEYTAMIFFPLIAYGLYALFTMDQEDERYGKQWVPLVIGYSGVIVSHAISMMLVFGFSLLIFMLLLKKFLRKKTLICVAKTFLFVALLNAWFLVPFIDYLQFEWNGNAAEYTMIRILSFIRIAEFLPQFFVSDYDMTGAAYVYKEGMTNEMPLSIGAASALILVAGLMLKGNKERKTKHQEGFIYFLAILTIFAASTIFPWPRLFQAIPFTGNIARVMQFPWRFNAIAVPLLALLAGLLAKKIVNKNMQYGFIALIILISCVQGWHFESRALKEMPSLFVPDLGSGKFYAHGGEYLPVDANQNDYINDVSLGNDNIAIDYASQFNHFIVALANPGEQTTIEIPRINYKGYQARHVESGLLMETSSGQSGRMKIDIPAGFRGNISVDFVSPFYWRFAELASLITLLCLSLGKLVRHEKSSARLVFAWNKLVHSSFTK